MHSAQRRRTRRHERGSLLLMSYFVVAMLLGLAIPQSMRALHYARLVQVNTDQDNAFYAAEAGQTRLLRTILNGATGIDPSGTVSNPFFGEQEDVVNDPGAMSHPFAGTTLPGVPSCNSNQGPTDWDCWPSTFPVPNAGKKYHVSFRAKELPVLVLPGNDTLTGPVIKRVQMVVYRNEADNPAPFTGTWVATHEVKVKLNRIGTVGGTMKAGQRLRVTTGNGIEDNIIKGQYIIGYGDALISGGTGYDDMQPISVGGSQAIWGRVWVKNSDDPALPGDEFDLCCDGPSGVGHTDEITLTNSGSGVNARIRQFPMLYPEYWRTLAAPQLGDPDYPTFNSAAKIVADSDNYITDFNKLAYPDDVPKNLPADMDDYTYEKVKPRDIVENDANCSVTINGPGGSGARSVTLCVASVADPNDPVLVAKLAEYRQPGGVCDGGDPDPTDDHHVYHLGQLAKDGETVEYCVNTINMGEGAELRVQGDRAQIFIRGYHTPSGVPMAMTAGANSTIFAFKRSETGNIPRMTEEYIHRFEGPPGTAEEFTNFRNALVDPNLLGHLSIAVLESNKYDRPNGSSPWQRIDPGADYALAAEFNKPQLNNRMAPGIRINGDIFLGTVNAPRSEVILGSDFMETRDPEAVLIGNRIDWMGRTLLITPRNGGPEENTSPEPAEVIAWRRCYAPVCPP